MNRYLQRIFTLKQTFALMIMLLALVVSPAWALTLSQAKSQGLVGEKNNGYLALVKPNPQASKLVNNVNAKRRQQYSGIASSNSTTLNVVEKIAGRKAINLTKPGHFYKNAKGQWIKK